MTESKDDDKAARPKSETLLGGRSIDLGGAIVSVGHDERGRSTSVAGAAQDSPSPETAVTAASQDSSITAGPKTEDAPRPETKVAEVAQDALPKTAAPAADVKLIDAAESLPIDDDMRDMINGARELLEFALLNAKKEGLAPVAENIIKPIAEIAYPSGSKGPATTSKTQWIDFLKAYDGLAALTRPVTARTLRDTRPEEPATLKEWIIGTSPTFRITRMLWSISVIFIFLAISYEFYAARYGRPFSGEVEGGELRTQIFGILAPFIYGGLGACAYLLRSAHALIAARAFDIHYKPEYLNRILLGVVSGGTATLFAGTFGAADTNVAKLSQAAIGFLAGYSTDFLFKTIERLLEALFPRTNPPKT